MDSRFVDARVLVRLPIGERTAIVVPADLARMRMGLDFITVRDSRAAAVERTVCVGPAQRSWLSCVFGVVTGLSVGDIVVPGHE